jgi:predicted outer membrane repeat protein
MELKQNGAGLGAGVYMAVASNQGADRTILEIRDSQIDDNSAWQDGGAVYVELGSSTAGADKVVINNSSLSNNIAGFAISSGSGGALFVSAPAFDTTPDSITITNSHLDHNATGTGGGFFLTTNSYVDLTIQNSTINNNHATNGSGGGLYLRGSTGSQFQIQDSTISENISTLNGGGVFVDASLGSSIEVENVKFLHNTAGEDGGGLRVTLSESSSLDVENSLFDQNSAGSDGGGIFATAASGISDPFPATRAITIARSVISGNRAVERAAGLYTKNQSGTEAIVTQSRITGNEVLSTGLGKKNGGGIYAYVEHTASIYDTFLAPKFTITGSTVDNNTAVNLGGGIFVCSKKVGTFIAANSTISGNRTTNGTTDAGGGLFIAVPFNNESVDAYLRNLTITNNVSTTGGGVATVGAVSTNTYANVLTRIGNSIISGNVDHSSTPIPNNLVGNFDEVKFNIIGSGSNILTIGGSTFPLDTSNVNSTSLASNNNLGLGALQLRGGLTPTHSLPAGSIAIDAGSNDLLFIPHSEDPTIIEPLLTDQRGTGFARSYDISSITISGAGPVDIGAYEINPPKVIGVIVSNSTTGFGYLVPVGSGEQIRTVPVGGADQISIMFSEDIGAIVQGDLTVTGHYTSNTYAPLLIGGFGYSGTTNTATWTFNTFPADQLVLTLGTGVTSTLGIQLDGFWLNPTSVMQPTSSSGPSGNGTAGNSFVFHVTILPGDATRDGIVNFGDYLALLNNFGGSGKGFTEGDFDGLGMVNFGDYLTLLNNYFVDLSNW